MTHPIPTVCGMNCDECDHYEKDCQGCAASTGRIFWTEYVGIKTCPIYECCADEKRLAHCGLCQDMPCERYFRFRDPDVTEEEAGRTLERQKEYLARRRNDG